MNFEIADNLFQVAVFVCMAIASGCMAVRYRDRRCLILSFAYASFMMGTLFWVLHLVITDVVPQVFCVPEISWLASYFFLISLQIVRMKGLKIHFSWIPLLCAAAIAGQIIHYRLMGPMLLLPEIFAATAGTMIYLAVYRLKSAVPFKQMDVCFLVCMILQVSLYFVSMLIADFTHFNLYFAVDITLTFSYALLLPLLLREVKA